jgi:hypothetical protein
MGLQASYWMLISSSGRNGSCGFYDVCAGHHGIYEVQDRFKASLVEYTMISQVDFALSKQFRARITSCARADLASSLGSGLHCSFLNLRCTN